MQKITFLMLALSVFAEIQSKATLNPTSGKPSPVHDVLDVLPIRQIQELEEVHLKYDDGFKAAVLYLQGPEWVHLVESVLKSAEYQKFAEMVGKYKVNISQALSCMRTHIESLKVTPSTVTAKPNLEPFIADIRKGLPIGDIAKALAITDNPEAKRIRLEIGSQENQKIAENLHNLPEMAKLREILKGMNFDVEPYISLVYIFLGWVH